MRGVEVASVGDGASEFSASSTSAVVTVALETAGVVAALVGSAGDSGLWVALHPVIKMAAKDKVMRLRTRKISS
ncbi:hypothetical protein [Glutamicibacter sp.]|uniref:hypothetical protein n=1 Tax=Glutamicibacter sp. TaxID=1931995 RepID=UPI002FE13957